MFGSCVGSLPGGDEIIYPIGQKGADQQSSYPTRSIQVKALSQITLHRPNQQWSILSVMQSKGRKKRRPPKESQYYIVRTLPEESPKAE